MTIHTEATAIPSTAELIAMVNAMRAENDTLRAKVAAKSTGKLKVTEKGAVSLYGLGRFPVTLYKSQWEKLAESMDEVKAFIVANADRLSVKPDKASAEAQS